MNIVKYIKNHSKYNEVNLETENHKCQAFFGKYSIIFSFIFYLV